MFNDDERGGNREGSDSSAPKKRKRITTNEKYEKVRIGGSSPDGQRERTPRYTNDRNSERNTNSERSPGYSNDRSSGYNNDRSSNFDRDRPSSLNSDRPSNYNTDRSRNFDNSGGNERSSGNYGNRERNYNTDRGNSNNGNSFGGNRERNYNTDRERNYNSDRSDSSGNDRGNRYPRDDNREGFQKKSYGNTSTSRSYGGDQRGGFKKTFVKRDGTGSFNKSGNKPYGKPSYKQNDRFASRSQQPQRQPEYHFNEEPDNSPIRLNKYIANTGLCSRREADEHIQAGLISVNDKVITELGVKVLPTDNVCYKGGKLTAEKKVYILLNKPKDYVTSVDDPHAKRTIMELVQGSCKERIYPVGRLDRMTTGVILLTNDGELTKKITHPASEIKKIYQVYLDKNVNPEDVEAIVEGITLEDGFIKVDNVGYIREEDRNLIGIEIHSGKNRIVRRIFEHFGYKVTRLDRILLGGLTKKGLSRGMWRYLTPKEVGFLKMLKV
jgi:23S rRNA pseudouridine2605 synthase